MSDKKYTRDQLRKAWGAGRASAASSGSALVGKWFLEVTDGYKVGKGGKIESSTADGVFLCLLFDWVLAWFGPLTLGEQRLLRMDEMSDFHFYDSMEELIGEYQQFVAKMEKDWAT